MRLESAVNSSREGLTAHGTAIAVIGDNVSNSNTVGYKESRVEFADLFSSGLGGDDQVDSQSAGSGVVVKQVRQLHQDGLIEGTGRQLDFAVGGKGFFLVGDPANPSLTRAGNFQLDAAGNLIDSNGLSVLGIPANGTALAALNLTNANLAGTATTAATILGNLDAEASVTAPPGNPETYRDLNQVASGVMTTQAYDSLGAVHGVDIYFFKTGANQWTAQAYMDGADVGGTAGKPTLVGTTNLTFDSSGAIPTANQAASTMTINAAYSNGAAAGSFTMAMGSFSQFASPTALTGSTVDGQGVGSITDYETDKGGQIFGVLDNGGRVLLGTIQLGTVPNVNGLVRQGNNLYQLGETSGALTTAAPNSNGLGDVEAGALERSTVDISKQFVDLVVFQRGYQANSQTLSVANQILRDTLGLLR